MIPRALLPYLAVLGVTWIGWLALHTPANTDPAQPGSSTPGRIYDGFTKGIVAALPFDSRNKFIKVAEETTLAGDFDPTTIQKVCASKIWPVDLVFQCDKVLGGIGNVRQEVLTCVRWAMELGVHMIIPHIWPRVDSNSTKGEETQNSWGKSASAQLSRLIDQDLFLQRMSEACPQMIFYEDEEEIVRKVGPVKTIGLAKIGRVESTRQHMRDVMNPWITANRAPWGNVSLVTLGRTFSDYEICDDGQDFADNFGRIAEMVPDVRRLAAAVLYEMSKRFNLNLDPMEAINQDGYIGIHLRTSADAMRAGWMGWEQQSSLYLKYLSRYKLPVVYIATGNLSTVDMFGELIAPTPVVTKFMLLSGAEATLLQSLTWDQQGEVDYLVLSKATRFLGTVDSSFSWGVAAARHALSNEGSCGYGAPRQGRVVRRKDKDLAVDDGLSIIIGTHSVWNFKMGRWWP